MNIPKLLGDFMALVGTGEVEVYNEFSLQHKLGSLGILAKKEEEYSENNEIVCGKCTVYVNKGTYLGGNTYAFSRITAHTDDTVEIHTGKFTAKESLKDICVILMRDKI